SFVVERSVRPRHNSTRRDLQRRVSEPFRPSAFIGRVPIPLDGHAQLPHGLLGCGDMDQRTIGSSRRDAPPSAPLLARQREARNRMGTVPIAVSSANGAYANCATIQRSCITRLFFSSRVRKRPISTRSPRACTAMVGSYHGCVAGSTKKRAKNREKW